MLQMESGDLSPSRGRSCYFRGCVFAESGGWDGENQLWASLWEIGASSESRSKRLEAPAFSNRLRQEPSAFAQQDRVSEIHTRTRLASFPLRDVSKQETQPALTQLVGPSLCSKVSATAQGGRVGTY